MNPRRAQVLKAAALALAAAGMFALISGPARASGALEGAAVFAVDGRLLGRVERVTRSPEGRPLQVLVRPARGLAAGPRSLSYEALELTEKGLRAPLSRAEFNAMPPVATARSPERAP